MVEKKIVILFVDVLVVFDCHFFLFMEAERGMVEINTVKSERDAVKTERDVVLQEKERLERKVEVFTDVAALAFATILATLFYFLLNFLRFQVIESEGNPTLVKLTMGAIIYFVVLGLLRRKWRTGCWTGASVSLIGTLIQVLGT